LPADREIRGGAGVKASVRAGHVRLSCHLPVTVDDIDRALTALT
jgi:hypothetical protein